MGLIQKIKAYLNEEDEEVDRLEEAIEKKRIDQRKKRMKQDLAKKIVEQGLDTGEISTVKARHAVENERKTAMDFCEQLIDVANHVEETKREYQVVTEYLTDIQRIEELPPQMAEELVGVARNIDRLDNNKKVYLQSENLLSMDKFNTMEKYENDIIDTVKNLNEMEMRDTLLKNDMGHLEGEKEDLRFGRDDLADRIDHVRIFMVATLVLFLLVVSTMLVVALATKRNMTIPVLVAGAVAAFFFAVAYISSLTMNRELKDYVAKINRAISLLNKVKVKYINNVNALDYIYEKYDINSSKELERDWELYNQMVRDAKKYYQTNSELRDEESKLVKLLKSYGIKDAEVWTKQVHAFIDKRELVEIKHGLITRRQKLRERLGTCDKIQENANIGLRACVAENPGLESLILDMLAPHKITVNLHS